MHIDWWTLALQALNVLILIWLLGRYFWSPVSRIIEQRQQAQLDLLAQAKAARDEACAEKEALARDEQETARRHEEALATARADAAQLREDILVQARREAQTLVDSARTEVARLHEAGQRQLSRAGAEVGLRIAQRLAKRLQGTGVQEAFCAALDQGLRAAPAALLASASNAESIDVVSAEPLDDPQRRRCEQCIHEILGANATLRWRVDPALLGGIELRAGGLVLRNSWQADLQQIEQELERG